MFTSSKRHKDLDGIRKPEGQSARAFVFEVLSKLEPQQDVEFLGAKDFAVVRNYVSAFAMNNGWKLRAMSRVDRGISFMLVRRDR